MTESRAGIDAPSAQAADAAQWFGYGAVSERPLPRRETRCGQYGLLAAQLFRWRNGWVIIPPARANRSMLPRSHWYRPGVKCRRRALTGGCQPTCSGPWRNDFVGKPGQVSLWHIGRAYFAVLREEVCTRPRYLIRSRLSCAAQPLQGLLCAQYGASVHAPHAIRNSGPPPTHAPAASDAPREKRAGGMRPLRRWCAYTAPGACQDPRRAPPPTSSPVTTRRAHAPGRMPGGNQIFGGMLNRASLRIRLMGHAALASPFPRRGPVAGTRNAPLAPPFRLQRRSARGRERGRAVSQAHSRRGLRSRYSWPGAAGSVSAESRRPGRLPGAGPARQLPPPPLGGRYPPRVGSRTATTTSRKRRGRISRSRPSSRTGLGPPSLPAIPPAPPPAATAPPLPAAAHTAPQAEAGP